MRLAHLVVDRHIILVLNTFNAQTVLLVGGLRIKGRKSYPAAAYDCLTRALYHVSAYRANIKLHAQHVKRPVGVHHVLAGKLSPVRHCGPDKLRIAELKDRIVREGFGEVLLALSTDMEGDATAGYLVEALREFPSAAAPVKVTRLAFGLPADSGVSYSDPLTLRRAIVHRCPA